MLEPLLILVSASTLDTVLSRAHPKDTLVDVLVADLLFAELDSFLRKHGFIRATDVPWHGNVVYERPQAGRFLKTCFWTVIYPAAKKPLRRIRDKIRSLAASATRSDRWPHRRTNVLDVTAGTPVSMI